MNYLTGKDFRLTGTAVTLGKFDGVHLGHRELLSEVERGKAAGLKSVMFTFNISPRNLLSDADLKQIDTNEERAALMSETGIDYLIDYPFTRETADQPAEEFVREVLVGKLGAKLVVVGEDFRFGRDASGDVALLESLAEPMFRVVAMPKKSVGGVEVSSSLIRGFIENGEMERATEFLGRPYFILGEIVHGKHLGNTVGMPTINQRFPKEKLVPPYGVYVSDVEIDGEVYRGITNVGVKPTVGDDLPGAETWIFDFSRDVYGHSAKVSLLSFVRPERKFESLEEVKAQVNQDAEKARGYVFR